MSIDRSVLSTRAGNVLRAAMYDYDLMTDDDVFAFLQDRPRALRQPGMGPKIYRELCECFGLMREGPRCGIARLDNKLRMAEEALDRAERHLAHVKAEHDAIKTAVLYHLEENDPTR